MADIALISKQQAGVSTHQLAVVERTSTEEQQVLELGRVAVVEHLAQQAIGHGVTRTAGELVEHLVLSNHSDIDAIDCHVEVGNTLSLIEHQLVADDEQVGNSHTVQILVLDCLIGGNLLQRLGRIKCDIL